MIGLMLTKWFANPAFSSGPTLKKECENDE
jgi:hypothetical protein